MHDGEHDALPVGADSNGDNRVLVVATLAALVLAGSAFVYRARFPHIGRSGREQRSIGMLENTASVLHHDLDDEADAREGHEIDTEHELGASGSSMPNDAESKESRSSRKKDRRRRGKDPLKEIFKGGKKLKGATSQTSSSGKNDATDSQNNSTPSSSSALPPSSSASSSFSRSSGKRFQRDTIASSSAGTTSVGHSRATSEVSQSTQGFFHIQDEFHQHTFSSLAAADDASARSYSPSASSQTGTALEERNLDFPSTRISQAPGVLAPAAIFSATMDGQKIPSSSPSRSGLATHPLEVASSSTAAAPVRLVPSPPASHTSSTSSTRTTTTTASSSAITPATSPTLSHTSSKSTPTLAPPSTAATASATVDTATEKVTETSNANEAASSSSSNVNIISEKTAKTKKQQKLKAKSPSPWDWDGAGDVAVSSSASADAINSNMSSLPSSSSTSLSLPSSSLVTAPAFPPETVNAYRKPPRLQPKSIMTGSVSHPELIVSPTSGKFGALSSGSVSASNLSRTKKKGKTGGATDTAVEEHADEDSQRGEKEFREEEEEDELTFPTLNPTVMTMVNGPSSSGAGPSRIRSSFTESSGASNSNNHPRRVPTPRRPPTPSCSTPPLPHSSASSTSGSNSNSNLHPPSGANTSSANPSSGQQMPALSMQTQIASLRGALEAARLREEKNKADLERYAKEMEVLRWETANSRRGEVELQAHLRHLMHQVQMYAALFTSVAPQLNSQLRQQPLQQAQVNGVGNAPLTPGGASTGSTASAHVASTTNGYTGSPIGAPTVLASGPVTGQQQPPPQQPQHLQMPSLPPLQLHMLSSHMNGMPSPGGMLSPLSAGPFAPFPSLQTPSSPFFPHPLASPLAHAHVPHPHPMLLHQMQQQFQHHQQHLQQHQQGQSPTQAQPSPHQANLFSMLFPPSSIISSHQPHPRVSSSSSTGSLSRPPSAVGTESAGSVSPELNGSPTAGSAGGKRRARTRTQTANGRMGGRSAWEDSGDGWVGVGIGEGDEGAGEGDEAENDHEEDDEGGFNEILADAILKRPSSIRTRSSSKKARLDSEKERGTDSEEATDQEREKDAQVAEVEQLTEFTFPSLSDLGNVHHHRGRMVNSDHSVTSSSSLPSPAVVAVANGVVGLESEDVEARVDVLSVDENIPQNDLELDGDTKLASVVSSSPDLETTPRKEESETTVTESSFNSTAVVEDAANGMPSGQ
ncbi:hypothetical protein B0H34DRAFT_717529 [Crassisporium funariophilum]|nr:hypothetical protein B0H34DRAFT_717529 [Crassisporium funariophilum]